MSEEKGNVSWLKWKKPFLAAVYDNIPAKTVKNVSSPPWINGEIIHEIKRKETVRRKLKSFPTDALRNTYKELRTKVFDISPTIYKVIQSDLGQFSN